MRHCFGEMILLTGGPRGAMVESSGSGLLSVSSNGVVLIPDHGNQIASGGGFCNTWETLLT